MEDQMSIDITKAQEADLQEILDLQYLAYQSEAKLLNNPYIPPLTQTLQELQAEFEKGIILKAVDKNECILGSVRAFSQDDTLHIGKLIVRSDMQGQKIGTRLLIAVAHLWPHQRYELFTSSKSARNIKLYERLGYQIFREQAVSPTLNFIYLEKIL